MPPSLDVHTNLGQFVLSFRLPDPLIRRDVGPADFPYSNAIVLAFLSSACPAVERIAQGINQFAKDYAHRGIQVIGINVGSMRSFTEATPKTNVAELRAQQYVFPYLLDTAYVTARSYGVICTPDFFLYDDARRLFYHGQFDASRAENDLPVTGADLRNATDGLLAGTGAPADQKASSGCMLPTRHGDEHSVRGIARGGVAA